MSSQNIVCKGCGNKSCIFSHNLSRKSEELIAENKTVVRYKKGQQIFFEGAPVNGIYFVLTGKVKIFKSGINGRQQIVRLAKPGDILGHRGFGGKSTYPIGATTIEDSLTCFIESKVFFEILRNDPELAINLILFYAEELKNTETRVRDQAQMAIREKIADALLNIYDTYKVNGDNTLAPQLSRQDIADIAGTNREQVSRFLTEFENDNVIITKGKGIEILNLQHLRDLLKPYHQIY